MLYFLSSEPDIYALRAPGEALSGGPGPVGPPAHHEGPGHSIPG